MNTKIELDLRVQNFEHTLFFIANTFHTKIEYNKLQSVLLTSFGDTRCVHNDRQQITCYYIHLLFLVASIEIVFCALSHLHILTTSKHSISMLWVFCIVFFFFLLLSLSFYLYFTIISLWIRIWSLCWISAILCGKNAILYSSFSVMPCVDIEINTIIYVFVSMWV